MQYGLNKKLSTSRLLAHEISTNVRIVDNINEVPNIPLYWVSNIGQYAIQVNGVLFRGNIGNIYNKTNSRTDKSTNQTVICKYGNKCKNILDESGCVFYHDQLDLLLLYDNNQISQEFFEIWANLFSGA